MEEDYLWLIRCLKKKLSWVFVSKDFVLGWISRLTEKFKSHSFAHDTIDTLTTSAGASSGSHGFLVPGCVNGDEVQS